MNTTIEPTEEIVKTNGHGLISSSPAATGRGSMDSPPTTAGNDGKNKKRRLLLLGAGVGLAAVLAIVPTVRSAFMHESTDDAFIDGHIITIAPKVAGQVTAVHVEDNQLVKAGDPLVEIDPRDYQAKVAEQRGKLAAAVAEADRAVADAARYEQIYQHDEVSRQQLDNARSAAASAQATVAKERGALDQDELNLSYTRITAPQDGRVTRKSVEAGSYVAIGEALLSVVPQNVWVTANFKETQLTHMRPGQKVTIKVDAYPGRALEGRVESIQSGTGARFSLLPPENATGNYVKVVQRVPVKILIDTPEDPNARLAPGMSVVPSVLVR
jgi:membrane fusion protein (multidrug efflux system)